MQNQSGAKSPKWKGKMTENGRCVRVTTDWAICNWVLAISHMTNVTNHEVCWRHTERTEMSWGSVAAPSQPSKLRCHKTKHKTMQPVIDNIYDINSPSPQYDSPQSGFTLTKNLFREFVPVLQRICIWYSSKMKWCLNLCLRTVRWQNIY